MAFNLEGLIGGSVGDAFAKIMSVFKVPPEQVLQSQTEIEKIKLDLAGKLQDAVTSEIQTSADVIKAEAQSQSWLPRNVRPLLLLVWGTLISFNYFIPLIAKLFKVDIPPVVLDPWVFKLTAIGFTGYVTARTWEKVTNTDN